MPHRPKSIADRIVKLRRMLPTPGWAGDALRVPSQTKPCELRFLYNHMLAARQNGIAIEVGSYLGASSIALAAGMKHRGGGVVYCIDTWQNSAMSEGTRDTLDEFTRYTRKYRELLRPLQGPSHGVNVPVESRSADLIFIDGDHSYEACSRDIERFSPFLREQGVLVLHDHRWYSTVTRAVGELLATEEWIVRQVSRNIIALTKDMHHKGRHVPVASFAEAA